MFGVKKVTTATTRPLGFSMFFASLAFAHFFAGPMVDYLRSDEVGTLTIRSNGEEV